MVIEQPSVKVGDTFSYRRFKMESGKVDHTGIVRDEVVDVLNERIIVRSIPEWTPDETHLTIYTRDWNMVCGARSTNVPYFPALKFPLDVGSRWRQSSTKNDGRSSTFWEYQTEGTVTGVEQVTVPAGTFAALRVDVRTPFEVRTGRGREHGHFEETFWWAKEVRKHIKYAFEDWTASGSLVGKVLAELVLFKHN